MYVRVGSVFVVNGTERLAGRYATNAVHYTGLMLDNLSSLLPTICQT